MEPSTGCVSWMKSVQKMSVLASSSSQGERGHLAKWPGQTLGSLIGAICYIGESNTLQDVCQILMGS